MRPITFIAAIAVVASAGGAMAQMQTALRGDNDHDGRLSSREYRAFQLQAVMSADGNGDGRISKAEFNARWNIVRAKLAGDAVGAPPTGKVGTVLWNGLDTDRDGEVAPMEIDALSASRFSKADTNKDGFVDRREIAAVKARLSAQAAAHK